MSRIFLKLSDKQYYSNIYKYYSFHDHHLRLLENTINNSLDVFTNVKEHELHKKYSVAISKNCEIY